MWICGQKNGASEGIRTLDIHVGNVMLYQLSYARVLIGAKFLPQSAPNASPDLILSLPPQPEEYCRGWNRHHREIDRAEIAG